MKVLWSIHLYPPKHCCGAEMMAHTISRYLISQGHEVKVLLHQANMHRITSFYEFEGVTVFPPDEFTKDRLFNWADVVCTHLDYTKLTIFEAAKYGKPVIHFIHNDTPYQSIIDAIGSNKIVYNSQWIADKLKYEWPSFVFPPPVDDWYKVENREKKYIIMSNLNENKGARFFYSVAKKLPNYNFIGIKGTYDAQILPQDLSNVKVVENTPNIRQYYQQAAIVMMPSKYESWGRMATEAMINGIPVIAHPTEGLKENLKYAGIFYDRKDTNGMAKEVDKLMTDDKYYNAKSAKCLKRAEELKPDFEALANFLFS